MSKSVIEVLTEARELVRKGWTQKTYCRDANDEDCAWNDPKATTVCLTCAIMRASPLGSMLVFYRALGFAEGAEGFYEAVRFNDAHGRTQAEVVALFDAAIAKAGAA